MKRKKSQTQKANDTKMNVEASAGKRAPGVEYSAVPSAGKRAPGAGYSAVPSAGKGRHREGKMCISLPLLW